MAQNFNEMTKEELEAVLNSDSIVKMSTVELNNLRKAVKAAGLLSVQYDNMLGVVINNRTYEEIKNSDKYTEEEKALALETRNEYNKEIYARIKDEHYNAADIMSRAVEHNGQYHFDDLTKGEMEFLLANGVVHLNELNIGKQYVIGQEKDRDFSKEIAKDTSNLSSDVKKSQEFWGNFNDNKSGIRYIVQALKDNSLKVEAQKDNKTVFTGIDHGNKGFDVVKKENTAEAYAIYDLIIKKAKTSNPKSKIRIKDNVQDPVLRNKILIACAKNNMEPIGNLPEGFDFAALKEIVKDIKDFETINALAENLYDMSGIEVSNVEEKEEKNNGAAIINHSAAEENVAEQAKPQASVTAENSEQKDNNKVAAVVINAGDNHVASEAKPQEEKEKNNKGAAVFLNAGEKEVRTPTNNVASESTTIQENTEKETPKQSWWKKAWDKSKKYVVIGGVFLLGLFGGSKGCSNSGNNDKDNQTAEKVENLSQSVDSLTNAINQHSLTDCDEFSRILKEKYNDGYMDGLAQGKEDCEEQNKSKLVENKKTTPVNRVKQTSVKTVKQDPVIVPKVVKTIKVPKFAPVEDDHRLQPIPEAPDPYANLPEVPRYVDEDAQKRALNTEKVTSEWTHGDMHQAYNFHGDMHENYESHEVVENKENVKKSKKQNVQTAWVLQSKGKEK